ncbi:MAG: hypothetical protein OXH15_08145 [Gammaproteobacteria bacterium]|nr:hypothetical protein [Gammaproteobacteria bacterium]
MRVDFILAAARAELLRTTRLTRTWLFALLASIVGLGLYQLGASLHLYQLVYSQPVPRFAFQGYGTLALAVLLFGTVFLAFDMRRRDARDRIADALDTTPVTNLELLSGRCLGVALIVWLLLVGIFGLMQVIGLVAMVLDVASLGEAVAPLPLFAFLTIDAVPSIVLWSALVVMLSSLLRSPLLAAAAAFTLGGAYLWLIFNAPIYLLPSISGIANLGLPGSDILPRLPGAVELAQRSALFMLAAAFLTFAAACDARPDSSRRGPQAAAGAGLLAAGSLVIGLLALALAAERAEPLRWADRHAAIEYEPSPDVMRVSGRVDIEPGQRLTVDVVLTLRSPSAEPLATLNLSLNPGMRIVALQVDGEEAAYEHEAGTLIVSPQVPVTGDTPVMLSVRAVGVPDPRFGYLDSAVRATDEAVLGIPLVLLGDEASIYDEDSVALMPGVHWLPSGGANYGADERAPDFRTIDLEVHAPSHWHVAGPGRSGGKGMWRFAPDVPVAKFALIAGAFERRTLGFEGTDYELLFHPMHADNVRRFDEPDGAFATWLKAEYLEPVVARGLDYPYGTFSLVEVPARLRRYGGGWRMDTVQALPGLQLLAEHGFPTRRFSRVGEDGLRWQMMDLDRMGPHTIHATAGTLRNLLAFATAPTGEGAAALDVLVEMLMVRWAGQPRWRGYHAVVPPAHWVSLPAQTVPLAPVERIWGFAQLRPLGVRGVPEADWRQFEQTPLIEVNPSRRRGFFELLAHRCDQVARAMHSLLGQERTLALLARLRREHAGSTYTVADFVAAVRAIDPSVGGLVDRWLREASAPGFMTSSSEVSRLADGPEGEPRYQIRVHVHNAQTVPGIVALTWRDEASAGFFDTRSPPFHRGAPISVEAGEAVEVGVVINAPPIEVRLDPFVSLNRFEMRLAQTSRSPRDAVDEEPLVGSRPSTWRQPGIVVDDLDPGFTVVSDGSTSDRGASAVATALLPPYAWNRQGWQRQADGDSSAAVVAWGRYRRTIARTPAGHGSTRAVFSADVPDAGAYRLAIHLPGAAVSEGRWRPRSPLERDALGSLEFELSSVGSNESVTFAGDDAVPGWNDVGVFDLPAGRVRVSLSDRTSGDVVVADAIRWLRETD